MLQTVMSGYGRQQVAWPGCRGGLKVSLIEVGRSVLGLSEEVTRLRWLWSIMVLVALTGAVGAYLFQRAGDEREEQMVSQAREAVGQISQRMRYLKTMERIDLNELGWPELIDPAWFNGEPPRNMMLSLRHPWMEVASPLDYSLDHPVQRVAINERLAGLWYNPAKGIVRARVPQTVSDQKTVELYNRVNGTVIAELFDSRPRKRILEELLRDDEVELEADESQHVGVKVRRRGGEAEPEADQKTEDAPVDESAPLIVEDEDDPAGPVRIDEDEGGPVSDEEPSREGSAAE